IISLALSQKVEMKLTANEVGLLSRIRNSMPQELANGDLLVFEYEHENEIKFKIDGELKVAYTGNSIGDHIYVNKNLIYKDGGNGQTASALELVTIIQIVFHELGHHHDLGQDHCHWLHELGAKIGRFALTAFSLSLPTEAFS